MVRPKERHRTVALPLNTPLAILVHFFAIFFKPSEVNNYYYAAFIKNNFHTHIYFSTYRFSAHPKC